MNPAAKDYLVIVQCDIVTERCSGYFCEKALSERTGGFAVYPADRPLRHVMVTCGGCCGRALQRKLSHLCAKLEQHEGIGRDRVAVQFATCITRESYHGPRCTHLDYLITLVDRLGLDLVSDTHISPRAEARRQSGVYEQ